MDSDCEIDLSGATPGVASKSQMLGARPLSIQAQRGVDLDPISKLASAVNRLAAALEGRRD